MGSPKSKNVDAQSLEQNVEASADKRSDIAIPIAIEDRGVAIGSGSD